MEIWEFRKFSKIKLLKKYFDDKNLIFFYETNFKIKFGSQRSQKSHLAFVCGLEPEFGARCTKNVLETHRFWSYIKENRPLNEIAVKLPAKMCNNKNSRKNIFWTSEKSHQWVEYTAIQYHWMIKITFPQCTPKMFSHCSYSLAIFFVNTAVTVTVYIL